MADKALGDTEKDGVTIQTMIRLSDIYRRKNMLQAIQKKEEEEIGNNVTKEKLLFS